MEVSGQPQGKGSGTEGEMDGGKWRSIGWGKRNKIKSTRFKV